ncbi:epsin-2 isoform X1 [Oryctolagus cuniculus]|uniref:epsin-2 isoform X1 n=1 Tax=Oryctolagus cuniculus TaxID=9986 RepID=UPI00387965DF
MTTSSIRRQMKNIVNNYSEAEIKVREATSNDPWGPSSSLMTEIADLTYNVVAFSEIMSMVWKRLNDHGKNWRHVYKALTLLDYLIKTGSERVAQQCRENIFAIQTLKDFQYIDRDGKDQGVNVREKSKQLVALLKDEERLKAERAQALKTKERMAQVATGMGSNQITFGRGSSQPNLSTSYSEQEYGKAGGSPASYHGSPEASLCPQHRTGAPLGQSEELQPLSQRHPFLPHLGLASRPSGDWSQPCLTCDRAARATSPRVSSELEQARPQTSGEEELQLQLALAMSREVAEQEERLRRGDDLRLQMALEESRRDTVKVPKRKEHGSRPPQTPLLDLLDALPSSGPATQKSEPWAPAAAANQTNPWGGPAAPTSTSEPWPSFGAKPAASVDPWGVPTGTSAHTVPKSSDPWAASQQPASGAGKTADAWGAASATKPMSASGSFELFSNLNGTVKDDFSEFDNLRTSKKAALANSPSEAPPPTSATSCPATPQGARLGDPQSRLWAQPPPMGALSSEDMEGQRDAPPCARGPAGWLCPLPQGLASWPARPSQVPATLSLPSGALPAAAQAQPSHLPGPCSSAAPSRSPEAVFQGLPAAAFKKKKVKFQNTAKVRSACPWLPPPAPCLSGQVLGHDSLLTFEISVPNYITVSGVENLELHD